jgi:hypothetical protein
MTNNKNLIQEGLDYIKIKKKWWLSPIFLLLIIVSIFIVPTKFTARLSR